jgi:pimeloyl-ACP methyl ester carboxylesterase
MGPVVLSREILVAGASGPLRVQQYRAAEQAKSPPYAVGPGSEPVLFIHPVNTGAAVWDAVARAVAADRPVLVPDLRGHGLSTKSGPFGVTDYAADVLEVLDQTGVERVHLVGGSIGGPVGVLLAALSPNRVLSIASFGGALDLRITDDTLREVRTTLEREGVAALLYQLIPGALAPQHRTERLIETAVEIARNTDRSAAVVYNIICEAFRTDVSQFAARCRVPSLIVNGSEDRTCTVADGQRMAAALGGTAVVLDGVGHLPMLEVPSAVTSLLQAHLNGKGRNPRQANPP